VASPTCPPANGAATLTATIETDAKRSSLRFETSCGIIPFRRCDDSLQYLLLHSALVRNPDAAWEFPKGSLDSGETEVEAALRELREETAITAIDILPDFRDQVEYRYRRDGHDIAKTVTFFTGEVLDWSPIPAAAPTREHGPDPHLGVWHTWAVQNKAYGLLFHPGMRQLLQRAAHFIYAHDTIQARKGG